MNMGNISNLSAITIFIFYFIVRVWTLFKDSKYPNLDLSVDIKQNYDDYDIDWAGAEVIVAKFCQNVRWLKTFKVNWNNDFTCYSIDEEVGKVEYVPANTEITIWSYVPEGIPNIVMQFELVSGIQGETLIKYDGRQNNTVISKSDIQLKRLLKAWLYYLVKWLLIFYIKYNIGGRNRWKQL